MNSLMLQFLTWIRVRPLMAGSLILTSLLAVANVFLWRGRQDAAQQLGEARQQGERLVRSLTNRPRIDKDLAAVRDALAQIDKNLVDERSMEVNLGYFYRLEKATRVRLMQLNQLGAPPPVAGSAYKVIPFSMHVTGSYRNNMNFLRSLETGPRILRIRSCSFDRVAVGSSEVTIDLTVEVLGRK
jgi:Tfp pilus assembly protein PilO